MSHGGPWRRALLACGAITLVAVGAGPAARARAAETPATPTTAWHAGSFAENVRGVVSRSDIVLGQPNLADTQSLPLGNGTLGVAAWAANGFTAQLNRDDTFPNRWSPGQVTIPGLAAMTQAPDFHGYLDVYDGVLHESGGGMTLTAWVAADSDKLIVDVTGADPGTRQTATVALWSGRTPAAAASGRIGALSETWVDDTQTGASGQTFGTLAAITAGGRDVRASVAGPEAVQVAFTPDEHGDFRVVVDAPHWAGGNALATAAAQLRGVATAPAMALTAAQDSWWSGYWTHTGLFAMTSADGSAQYMEDLRTIYLYAEAASMRGRYAGSQAGVADMFAFDRDQQDWYPAGYWIWNLRTQVSADLSSGNPQLITPLLRMYLGDLPAIEAWTRSQMGGLPGACVPETMRFNGNGYYNGGDDTQNASCALASSPSYNAETITSGAEVAMWVWDEYENTRSRAFLVHYLPLLAQTARFLLADQKLGPDGLLHGVANAHETQWAVKDPITDVVAMRTLFAVAIQASAITGQDIAMAGQLRRALGELPPLPRVAAGDQTDLLNPDETQAETLSADAAGSDVFGNSFQPAAPLENVENLGLEPAWPWGIIGDDTSIDGDDLTAIEDRTFTGRPYVDTNDWSFDAIDAARLDMPTAVQSNLVAITEKYQPYISGFGNVFGSTAGDEPYLEQSAGVATALDEALATQYDGVLRVAPAWPSDWNVSGTVTVEDDTTVDVQVQDGTLTTAAILAGAAHSITLRNPWPGQQAEIVDGRTGQVIVAPTSASTIEFTARAGGAYLVQRPAAPTSSFAFAAVTGARPTAAVHLGPQQIGLDPASPEAAGRR